MGTTRLSAQGKVGRGLSPEIWQAYGFIGGNHNDPSLQPMFFDDFEIGTPFAEENTAMYQCLLQNGTITQSPDVNLSEGEYGVAVFTLDGTDNNQVSIQTGGATGNLVKIDDTAGENGVVAFECRVQLSTITNGDIKCFFGLAETNKSVNDGILADADATRTVNDHIGFVTTETDGASIQRVFCKTSGTEDTEDTDDDFVINTWTKLGFVYDPNQANDKKIIFYIDGEECTSTDTRVTATDLADDTNFPSGEEMAPIIVLKCGAGAAADTISVDWWACGQGFTS